LRAYRDAPHPDPQEREIESKRLIPDETDTRRLVSIWISKAMQSLHAPHEPKLNRCGGSLASTIAGLGEALADLKALVATILATRSDGLDMIFCGRDLTDFPAWNFGLPEVPYLPPAEALLEAAKRNPEFIKRHPKRIAEWRAILQSSVGAAPSQ
jgi:hypothetical protein